MTQPRILIVNADDFGLTAGVNRGIVEAHERGIVTSASLMVRGTAAVEAAEYAKRNVRLDVGLHIDLGEWSYQHGHWYARYEVVPAGDESAIEHELRRQLDRFQHLTGKTPTHIDSHQHVHRQPPVCAIASKVARELGVPLRHRAAKVRYCGDFYGQNTTGETVPESISVDTLLEIIRKLPPGVTELACHPGYADDLDSDYKAERELEIRALCAPEVRATLLSQDVQLHSFHNLEH